MRFFRGFGPSHVLPMPWPPVVPGSIPSFGDTRAIDSARTVSAAAPVLHLGVRVGQRDEPPSSPRSPLSPRRDDPPPTTRRRSRSLGRRTTATMTLAAALRSTSPDEADALESPVSPTSPPPRCAGTAYRARAPTPRSQARRDHHLSACVGTGACAQRVAHRARAACRCGPGAAACVLFSRSRKVGGDE